MQKPFMAYENDTDRLEITYLTVTNGMDKITIQGTLDLTKDPEGLKNVLKIKRVIDAALEALRRDKNLD
jgi:hypothetical protein